MSMTRKDYVLLADTLKAARDAELGTYKMAMYYVAEHPTFGTPKNIKANEHTFSVAEMAHDFIARRVADALGKDNPRFDVNRFLAAAGHNER